MSGQLSAAMMFVSLVAIAFATNRADDKERTLGSLRAPASLRHTQKISGPLSIDLSFPDQLPSESGTVFTLTGRISTTTDLESVDFKWALDPGVEVVSGLEHGILQNIAIDQPKEVTIVLKKTTDENVRVHLVAKSLTENFNFSQTAQFNTNLEFDLREQRQALKKSTLEFIGRQENGQAPDLKVHQ